MKIVSLGVFMGCCVGAITLYARAAYLWSRETKRLTHCLSVQKRERQVSLYTSCCDSSRSLVKIEKKTLVLDFCFL